MSGDIEVPLSVLLPLPRPTIQSDTLQDLLARLNTDIKDAGYALITKAVYSNAAS